MRNLTPFTQIPSRDASRRRGGGSQRPRWSEFLSRLSTSQWNGHCWGTSGLDWSKVGAGKKVSQVHCALPDSLLFHQPNTALPPQVQ